MCLAIMTLSITANAQAPDPDPGRFTESIAAFESWDSKNSFPEDSILFVGSSSIRFWPTATAFPGKPIINRGFGGSEISDVNHYFEQVVSPYNASMVLLYAGDNDIARGKGPEQVFEDFREFAAKVRAESGQAMVLYISIKPSDARWEHWPAMMEANDLIREYIAELPGFTYVDLAMPLLKENGQPRDVFIGDGLHLNDYGYEL